MVDALQPIRGTCNIRIRDIRMQETSTSISFIESTMEATLIKMPRRWAKGSATVISDSICRDLPVQGIDIQAFGGCTLERLQRKLKYDAAWVAGYDLVVLHIGTNNIEAATRPSEEGRGPDREMVAGAFLTMMEGVVAECLDQARRHKAAPLHIVISSILPRPRDYKSSAGYIVRINSTWAEHFKGHCWQSFNRMLAEGHPKAHLYKDDIHLNKQGKMELARGLVNFLHHNRPWW